MEGKNNRRVYDREFKDGAVAQVQKGRKVSEVARNLGIRENMLWRWTKEAREATAAGISAFPGSGHLNEADAEMKHLRKELENMREERDILKKALAIFSKTPNQGTHS
jgi:transposase